jgi:uncharacterized protein (TIGR02118 family)
MIRLSVLYPVTPSSTFDWAYYMEKHLPLAGRLLTPLGLIRLEVDRGLGAFPPGAPSHYHAVAYLFFASVEELGTALAATAAELTEDQKKYYNDTPVFQISQVVPV